MFDIAEELLVGFIFFHYGIGDREGIVLKVIGCVAWWDAADGFVEFLALLCIYIEGDGGYVDVESA